MERVTLGEREPIFSSETVADWVTWGSHVLTVDVVDDEPLTDLAVDAGPYRLLPRTVSVVVREVTWSHPGAITDVSAGEELTLYDYPAYAETGGVIAPAIHRDDVRMEVGTSYVVLLADEYARGQQGLTILRVVDLDEAAARVPWGSQALPLTDLPGVLADAQATVSDAPRAGETLLQRWARQAEGVDNDR